VRRAVRDYLGVGRALSAKVHARRLDLCDQPVAAAHCEGLAYFHRMLDQHLDLVQRRLLNQEALPAHEKVFSLFEPHPEWIQKGKPRPNVELGHRLLIATDPSQLIQDDDLPVGGADVDQSIPGTDRLLGRYGAGRLASLSFDKGFPRAGDREWLSLSGPTVVMPKRGKNNVAELERQRDHKFGALRPQHSAVESQINRLEHPGLNRCLDVGLPGYLRYVGYGVRSYNLHVIGRELLARGGARAKPVRWAAGTPPN
jgi:transposase, IS5 family